MDVVDVLHEYSFVRTEPRHLLILAALVLAPLPLRLWLAGTTGLAPDEAYYWLWSQELSFGYPDHPPLVAWLIGASTRLLGDSVLAIRAPALLLGGVLLPCALYWLAREAGTSRRAALLLPTATFVQPLGLAGSLLMTPDVPLILAWTCCIAASLRGVSGRSGWSWLVAGLALGLALLSKHSGWLLLFSIALAFGLDKEARQRLRTVWPWAGLTLGLAVASPNLLWDGARGFSSLGFQLGHGLAPSNALGAPQRLLELLGAQIGLLTPIVAFGVWRYLRTPRIAAERRLLWIAGVTPLAVFAVAALLAQPEANWPAPAHPLLLAGALAWLRETAKTEKKFRSSTAWALGTSALVTALAVLHLVHPLPPFPPDNEPTARLRGWGDLPSWLENEAGPISADGYELASALTYHLPRHPEIIDGAAEGPPRRGGLIVVAAPGTNTAELPSWAESANFDAILVGDHPMSRSDGSIVRTLRGFRLVER